jgi:alpha-beta hydrolase superfamily lysophospholipase
LLSATEVQEHFRMSDGFSLFYRSWKPADHANKKVVCIHGMGSHSGAFKPIGESLSLCGIHVVGLDLRGFGNSVEDGLPRGDTKSFSRHMQDLDEAVNLLRNGSEQVKIYMLGHSLGGCYVLWYAANYPDALDGLILVAPAIEVTPKVAQKERVRFSFLLFSAPETMIETQAALVGDEEQNKERTLLFDNSLRTTRFSVRWLSGVGRNLMRQKPFGYASKIKKPTLVVQGEADQDAFPKGAKRLFGSLASENKLIKIFPEADHSLYNSILRFRSHIDDLERKEEVITTIKNWLERN